MPTLQNPRYEAFAQARAKGALLIDAYESAGFVRHRGHPSRLAWKPEVAERIAELRKLQTYMEDLTLNGLLISLRRIIKAGEGSDTPALVNAARLAVLDASRLQADLAKARAAEQLDIAKDFKDFAAADLGDEPPEGRSAPPQEAAPAALAAPKTDPGTPQKAPVSAPPAPIQRPRISPAAPSHLLASAAPKPLALPGLSAKAGPLAACLNAARLGGHAPASRARDPGRPTPRSRCSMTGPLEAKAPSPRTRAGRKGRKAGPRRAKAVNASAALGL